MRTVLAGQKYEMPPAQDKADPTKASAEDFETVIAEAEGIRIDKALSNAFFGLSPKMAAKLCENATDKCSCGELSPEERREALRNTCTAFTAAFRKAMSRPALRLMTLANLRECCRLYQRRENTDRRRL